MKRDLGADVAALPGAGAAGGLGAGSVAFLGATLQRGAEWILDTLGIERLLDQVDLVLTSEGRFDGQTLGGKAPMALARRAAAHGKPCIVLAGSTGPGWEAALDEGVTSVFPLVRGNVTLAQAIAEAASLLADRAEEAVRSMAR
jgi:glycerate kinase